MEHRGEERSKDLTQLSITPNLAKLVFTHKPGTRSSLFTAPVTLLAFRDHAVAVTKTPGKPVQ